MEASAGYFSGEERLSMADDSRRGLHDFVKAKYGATCCRVMTRQWAGDNFMSPERKAHCIEITGVVTEWVANALIDDGKLAVPAA